MRAGNGRHTSSCVERADGSCQVAIGGRPVYHFAKDGRPKICWGRASAAHGSPRIHPAVGHSRNGFSLRSRSVPRGRPR
ncbi:hypothetical protein ABZV91_19360 [Nocardia sp. NPDC004568]|uniref:hypothetical protein n=1 Tax=Nocardia sp. NPDC004568 TaxID=3154551 RepID=UPI0033AD1446